MQNNPKAKSLKHKSFNILINGTKLSSRKPQKFKLIEIKLKILIIKNYFFLFKIVVKRKVLFIIDIRFIYARSIKGRWCRYRSWRWMCRRNLLDQRSLFWIKSFFVLSISNWKWYRSALWIIWSCIF